MFRRIRVKGPDGHDIVRDTENQPGPVGWRDRRVIVQVVVEGCIGGVPVALGEPPSRGLSLVKAESNAKRRAA